MTLYRLPPPDSEEMSVSAVDIIGVLSYHPTLH